jgi:hypothetical protein
MHPRHAGLLRNGTRGVPPAADDVALVVRRVTSIGPLYGRVLAKKGERLRLPRAHFLSSPLPRSSGALLRANRCCFAPE